MYLEEIWRYPVKSMAGERLETALLDREGVEGDRRIQVHGERIVTARSRPALLGHHATIDERGEVLVDGRPWRDASVAADVERAAGKGSRLVPSNALEHRYDILPLLVATDGAIDSLQLDRRRFRPNLYIAGVEGLAERGWEGRRLRIGDAVVALADLRGRCVMTTFDPDTLKQDPKVLRTIVERLGGVLGLNAEVARAGRVRVGDRVELL
ncbi:MAG: MOSC N-terminal beta barrel domain-containing protein [Thermoanaerobaculia bacterium]